MATQLQFRRGTTAENNVFTGAVAEPTYDTDTGALRIHDGTTAGGKIIDTLVAFQLPTADNNYTWYRKYSTGWVEQGGITTSGSEVQSVSLPITMADTNYTIQLTSLSNDVSSLNNVVIVGYENISTTGFDTRANAVNKNSQTSTSTGARRWFVAGMAA